MMDTTDREIVKLLRDNGRLSHEEISREIHLSRPAIHDRVRRMEANGVIQGYRAEVDWEALGLPLTAFMWIRVTGVCNPTAQKILALSSSTSVIEECHRVAGEWCLLIKTHSANSNALQDLLDSISSLPNVTNTMTTLALSTMRLEQAGDACEIPKLAARGMA
ncbi:Lrp/AsnC family transcriptional regulator [bacterium]|nr:MAG: Lrp/AsnC family transcriptional regulator [bacterium]